MQPRDPHVPLVFVDQGVRTRLIRIGGSQRIAHRLAELGFVSGVELSVVADNGEALVVAVGDARLALEYALAQALIVAMEDV
ncbi:FeoA family protein [Chloroflexus sp.]|uniref:FeoA family protein n=1 Tax=Chloroflexus sp. TaxID=1904827 RepID=UPI00404A0D48